MTPRQPTHDDDLDRFWSKVRLQPNGCWQWVGSHVRGYGQLGVRGRMVRAHRWLYQQLIAPIDPELDLDHLCRNRACVNPAHLEPVTHAENVRRAAAVRTHCKRGHAFTEANTYVPPNGQRVCRTCEQERARQRYERDGEQMRAAQRARHHARKAAA